MAINFVLYHYFCVLNKTFFRPMSEILSACHIAFTTGLLSLTWHVLFLPQVVPEEILDEVLKVCHSDSYEKLDITVKVCVNRQKRQFFMHGNHQSAGLTCCWKLNWGWKCAVCCIRILEEFTPNFFMLTFKFTLSPFQFLVPKNKIMALIVKTFFFFLRKSCF